MLKFLEFSNGRQFMWTFFSVRSFLDVLNYQEKLIFWSKEDVKLLFSLLHLLYDHKSSFYRLRLSLSICFHFLLTSDDRKRRIEILKHWNHWSWNTLAFGFSFSSMKNLKKLKKHHENHLNFESKLISFIVFVQK